MLPSEIFREYDIRGVVGKDLTPEGARQLGEAYAAFLREQGSTGPVVVGRDNRRSSPELAEAIQGGLLAGGYRVVDIGEVATPIFYYARVLYGLDGGVMVTASHNPPEFNGFKLAMGYGTIYGEQIQRVRELAQQLTARPAGQPEVPTGSGPRPVAPSEGREERDPVPAYLQMLREKIRLGPRRLKVVVDCGNGTMSGFAPRALEGWGCQVVPLYCQSDPTFPHHHPDPIQPRNLVDLIAKVKEEKADLGVGYDGDGDRLGVVAEDGSIIWG
ncbi:MAG TPA: phosphomannomutase, partial [Firmicutes bacterium]|nr:phosphomannomutase [Bacillota bacterium]